MMTVTVQVSVAASVAIFSSMILLAESRHSVRFSAPEGPLFHSDPAKNSGERRSTWAPHYVERRSLGTFAMSFMDDGAECVAAILEKARGYCYAADFLKDMKGGASFVYKAPCSRELRRMYRKILGSEPLVQGMGNQEWSQYPNSGGAAAGVWLRVFNKNEPQGQGIFEAPSRGNFDQGEKRVKENHDVQPGDVDNRNRWHPSIQASTSQSEKDSDENAYSPHPPLPASGQSGGRASSYENFDSNLPTSLALPSGDDVCSPEKCTRLLLDSLTKAFAQCILNNVANCCSCVFTAANPQKCSNESKNVDVKAFSPAVNKFANDLGSGALPEADGQVIKTVGISRSDSSTMTMARIECTTEKAPVPHEVSIQPFIILPDSSQPKIDLLPHDSPQPPTILDQTCLTPTLQVTKAATILPPPRSDQVQCIEQRSRIYESSASNSTRDQSIDDGMKRYLSEATLTVEPLLNKVKSSNGPASPAELDEARWFGRTGWAEMLRNANGSKKPQPLRLAPTPKTIGTGTTPRTSAKFQAGRPQANGRSLVSDSILKPNQSFEEIHGRLTDKYVVLDSTQAATILEKAKVLKHALNKLKGRVLATTSIQPSSTRPSPHKAPVPHVKHHKEGRQRENSEVQQRNQNRTSSNANKYEVAKGQHPQGLTTVHVIDLLGRNIKAQAFRSVQPEFVKKSDELIMQTAQVRHSTTPASRGIPGTQRQLLASSSTQTHPAVTSSLEVKTNVNNKFDGPKPGSYESEINANRLPSRKSQEGGTSDYGRHPNVTLKAGIEISPKTSERGKASVMDQPLPLALFRLMMAKLPMQDGKNAEN